MSIDDWLESVDATPKEALDLRWYLAFLRWRKSMEFLFRVDA